VKRLLKPLDAQGVQATGKGKISIEQFVDHGLQPGRAVNLSGGTMNNLDERITRLERSQEQTWAALAEMAKLQAEFEKKIAETVTAQAEALTTLARRVDDLAVRQDALAESVDRVIRRIDRFIRAQTDGQDGET
jgi:prefoldin subunit 5